MYRQKSQRLVWAIEDKKGAWNGVVKQEKNSRTGCAGSHLQRVFPKGILTMSNADGKWNLYGLKVNYCIEQYGGHWWFGKSRKIIAVKEDSN